MTLCCTICLQTFSSKSNLYRHTRKQHNISDKPLVSSVTCDICGFVCRFKQQLICHLKVDHGFGAKKKKCQRRLKCPLCDITPDTYQSLDQHIILKHNFQISEEYFQFENETEFRSWKSNIEKDSETQYCAERGIRKLASCLQREYVCHRSYQPVSKITERKKSFKRIGSNKIGAACPSRMIVKYFKSKRVKVNFVRCHVGHSNEVMRTTLSIEHRAEIAAKAKDGVPIQRIIDDVRDSADPSNIERIHYLSKQDVRNIIRDFSIGYIPRLHTNDMIGVETLVSTSENLPDSQAANANSLKVEQLKSKYRALLGLTNESIPENVIEQISEKVDEIFVFYDGLRRKDD